MTDIRLDRTFWPVGHGAFYTERFYDHKDGRIFTAIYDCGSGRRWGKTQNGTNDASPKTVQQMIEDFLPSQKDSSGNLVKDIDIAFVSHLHVDHVNGLPTLLPRIKRLVLPQLTDCKLLEAYLYNAFSDNIDENNEINQEGTVDTESDVQQFIIRLAQRELGDGISLIEVTENEGEASETIDLEALNETIPGGTSCRVRLSQDIFWIYKPVNVDFSSDKCNEILEELLNYVADNSLRGIDGKIDWHKVAEAVRKAGITKVVEIYKKVFDITDKNSQLHNSYSMPVYSGPAASLTAYWRGHAYMDIHMHDMFHCISYINIDVFCHPFYSMFGWRNKLLSCLYMGDFNTKDNKKFSQLQRILGEYYNIIGIQQVPHHFSAGNHQPELYRGPLFAFGNISSKRDRSFKQKVYDDIHYFGCNPLCITRNKGSLVRFNYDFYV